MTKKLDRRNFMRIALGAGAAAFIPKELMAAKPDVGGTTQIFIEGVEPGDEIVVTRECNGEGVYCEKVTDKDLDHQLQHRWEHGGLPIEGVCIEAPLKWGPVHVHLTKKTHSDGTFVGPGGIEMGFCIETAETTEIDHDRKPKVDRNMKPKTSYSLKVGSINGIPLDEHFTDEIVITRGV